MGHKRAAAAALSRQYGPSTLAIQARAELQERARTRSVVQREAHDTGDAEQLGGVDPLERACPDKRAKLAGGSSCKPKVRGSLGGLILVPGSNLLDTLWQPRWSCLQEWALSYCLPGQLPLEMNASDLSRLEPEEHLNDSLVLFGVLKVVQPNVQRAFLWKSDEPDPQCAGPLGMRHLELASGSHDHPGRFSCAVVGTSWPPCSPTMARRASSS